MEALTQARLFGAGLVPIDTPPLVSRYNECLQELGIAKTELQKFSIDGLGWSPEIAEERKDRYYLSAGISNQMGIILSPNQRNKPIYFPFHSYDKTLMEFYFHRFQAEIADITASRGISLDIDQELTNYESPADLRLVDSIVVRSSTGRLGPVAKAQGSLVEEILNSDNAWSNEGKRKELLLSAKLYGDLRYRKIEMSDFRFDDLKSYFTRAFGGVFVIQTLDARCKLLLFDDSTQLPPEAWKRDMFAVQAKETLELLMLEKLVELNLHWYQSFPQVLVYLKDCLALDEICKSEPNINYSDLTPTQRKMKLAAIGKGISEVYRELERLIKQLQSTAIPEVEHLSPELRLLLLRPNRNISLGVQQTIRQVLHRMRSVDLIQLYADDKDLFYARYSHWPPSKRAWILERVCSDPLSETQSS